MPYIKKEKRKELADFRTPLDAGELNYVISKTIDKYIFVKGGVSYTTLNEIIGVLECAKLELYRRVAAVYEDQKLSSNGEVYFYGVTKVDESKQSELFPEATKAEIVPTSMEPVKYGQGKFS